MKFWIARDRDNKLYLYRDKPFKNDGDVIFHCQCNNIRHFDEYFELDESLFTEITFKNSPKEVELKLVKK